MRIVLVGPPGAGKGTQAQFIATHLSIPKISTGDIFRANITGGTELGVLAKRYMDKGDLVPDEVTIAMVNDRIHQDDAKGGFLLDGFPRNVSQAEKLREMLADDALELDLVVELRVDEGEVVRRLSGRRTCSQCGRIWHVEFDEGRDDVCDSCGGKLFQRDDDKEDVVRHRLEVYKEQTAPIVSFYEKAGILVGIDATGSVEEVTARALAALK